MFTSDHGDLLGAHGGLLQKWHNAFDEAIRVPLLVSGPDIDPGAGGVEIATSHVDLVPTLLGLAGVDVEAAAAAVARHHVETQPLPGRDLGPLLTGTATADAVDAPVYFMTEDQISRGLRMTNRFTGEAFEPVGEPDKVESVITRLPTGRDGALELWKLNHYYERLPEWQESRGIPADPFAPPPVDVAVGAAQPQHRPRGAHQRRHRRRRDRDPGAVGDAARAHPRRDAAHTAARERPGLTRARTGGAGCHHEPVQARVRATVTVTAIVRAIVMAIVTAVALLPASPALAAVAADDVDAPPSPLPAAAPGALIRAEPIGAPAGARAWRILYHSRALDGRDVAESGLVVAPTGPVPPGGRPVMSWAHGTSGLADTCAPSRAADAAERGAVRRRPPRARLRGRRRRLRGSRHPRPPPVPGGAE